METTNNQNLVEFNVSKNFDVTFTADSTVVLTIVFIFVVFFLIKLFQLKKNWKSFELNEAEFGLGDHKIKFSPNTTDMQIAYKIWVELSTRKVGLPIDEEHDVIAEIYDSWFTFFSVTRELIKDVPVQKFKRKDTEQIIRLSIDVLNKGIRPHLTQWQARFRRWYEFQLKSEANLIVHPQDIQREFPEYHALLKDLLFVNERLIKYRKKMYEIIQYN